MFETNTLVHVIDGTAQFGPCGYNETVSNESDPFIIEVEADAPSKVVLFVVEISDGEGYGVTDSLYIPIGPATVLLVDDDQGLDYDDYFSQGLLLTYPFEYWDVALQGVPSDQLSQYEAIVWMTGDDRTASLTSEEQTALREYLDGGGNLFISGQNIGYDLVEDGSVGDEEFFEQYLHASYVGDESADNILSGVSGDPISDDMLFLTLESGGAANQDSPSVIEPGEGASTVFTYSPSGDAAGIKFSGSHRVVYFAFGYEGIGDFFGQYHSKRRATIMDNVINWFRFAPQKGDVSEDGKINVIDVVIGVNIILGSVQPTPDQFWAADFTADGTVNVLDIVQIVNVILGSQMVNQ